MHKVIRRLFALLAIILIVLGVGRILNSFDRENDEEVFIPDIEDVDEPDENRDVEDSSNNDDDEEEELELIVSPETMKIINGILLVNKEYALPMDYDPGEDPEAREYLDKMLDACYDEIGKPLTAFSGYRTYDYQKNLFNRYVEKDGYDNAMMYSAKPRHSEHETGLAFDIGGADQALWLKDAFEATEEGIWLKENAHRFGFILRYPKGKTDITGYIYEPWHFRYIGIEDARKIYELDITLEEYLLY